MITSRLLQYTSAHLYFPLEATAKKVYNASTLQLKIKICVCIQNNLAFSFYALSSGDKSKGAGLLLLLWNNVNTMSMSTLLKQFNYLASEGSDLGGKTCRKVKFKFNFWNLDVGKRKNDLKHEWQSVHWALDWASVLT